MSQKSHKSRITRITDFVYDHTRHKDAWQSASQEPVAGFDSLRGQKYALLTTYKKSGEPVPSPVWFGLDTDGRFYFTTEEASPKVRRMRNNPAVRIAPSKQNGKPLGPPAEGTARVLPPEDAARAEAIIAANYGRGRTIFDRVTSGLGVAAVYVEVTPG